MIHRHGWLITVMLLAVCLMGAKRSVASLPWPEVAYGMSVTEVTRHVAGVHADRGSLQLDSFRYAGQAFTARFEFTSGRLTQVHLADSVFMAPNATTRRSFDHIETALRATYGTPLSSHVDARASGLSGEALWRPSGSGIALTISPVTQQHSQLLLNFFERK